MQRSRMLAVGLASVAIIFVITGCSSSTTRSGSATVDKSTSSQVAEAAQLVKQYTSVPSSIGVTQPLLGKPTPGKTIAYINCGVSECESAAQGVQQAAAAAGWKAVNLPFTLSSTQSLLSAFSQAISDHADIVAGACGLPTAAYPSALAELKSANIPFIACVAGPADIIPPVVAAVADPTSTEINGKMLADFSIADSGGAAHTLLVEDNEQPAFAPVFAAYRAETSRLCANCRITSIDVTIAQFEGGAVPGMIVSTLERDPSISYICFAAGSYSAGIESALKGAGLTRVKVIGQAGISSNWAALRAGTEAAWNGFPYGYLGWLIVDTAIRDLSNDPFQSRGAKIPFQLFTQADAPVANFEFQGAPNYQEQFKKLWHLG